MYRLKLVCRMWNCDICTGYSWCVNMELCNCDICTGYSWCAECGIVTYVQVTAGVLNVELCNCDICTG